MGFLDSGMIGGGLLGLASGKDSSVQNVGQSAWQKQAIGFLRSLVSETPTLPTQEIAGMSQAEQLGQGQLMGIMSGEAFQDPRTSPAYKGFRAESMAQEQAGADQLRRRAQLGGAAMSSGAFGAESRYRQGMANSRLSQLGQLYESERARDNPYTRMAAATQYGALPRQLEQAALTSQYQSQLQQALFPYTQQAAIAEGLMGHEPTRYMEPGEPSILSQLMPLLLGAGGFAVGGPAGGMAGAQIGGALGSSMR